MIADCGITSPEPASHPAFVVLHKGWGHRTLPWEVQRELAVLLSTPGIPFRWVAHVFRWRSEWQDRARVLVNTEVDAGRENAASITEDDARRMLALTRSGFKGEVPQPISMILAVDGRPSTVLAAELGVSRHSISRWRKF